jgi:hypothetical protein
MLSINCETESTLAATLCGRVGHQRMVGIQVSNIGKSSVPESWKAMSPIELLAPISSWL